ncbi:hypothetical protein [uncultured Senegalimassilia sp.]|uniref:hypothetical protein n=1 Tax=uncultured Senegalimassilia sp. TaxID=1714350 RepID=UPI00258F2CE4|nr:hypothetical protein [uncultured Senegalimassilia sp.]
MIDAHGNQPLSKPHIPFARRIIGFANSSEDITNRPALSRAYGNNPAGAIRASAVAANRCRKQKSRGVNLGLIPW